MVIMSNTTDTAATPADNTPSKEAQALALWQEWFDKGGYPVCTSLYPICVFCEQEEAMGHDRNCLYIRAALLTGQEVITIVEG